MKPGLPVEDRIWDPVFKARLLVKEHEDEGELEILAENGADAATVMLDPDAARKLRNLLNRYLKRYPE